MSSASPGLTEHREEFSRRRFLAMPLAGTIAWAAVAMAGSVLSTANAAIFLFAATGTITYLGLFISKFTGENFLAKRTVKNPFDALFMHTVAMSLLVYAIAVPFYLVDRSSLPLTVGILTGLMWLPLSWTIQHWIGVFHAVTRTATILVLWYLLPTQRFVAITLAIVVIYAITMLVLERRWRDMSRRTQRDDIFPGWTAHSTP